MLCFSDFNQLQNDKKYIWMTHLTNILLYQNMSYIYMYIYIYIYIYKLMFRDDMFEIIHI